MVEQSEKEAKAFFIRAYFERLEGRARFAQELWEAGRKPEALLLACACIEAVANFHYFPNKESRYNFAKLLVEHGEVKFLKMIHPVALLDAIRGRSSQEPGIAEKLEPHLPLNPTRFMTRSQLEENLRQSFTEPEFQGLLAISTLGTVAAVAYKFLRNPLAHWGSEMTSVSFNGTELDGQSAPDVTFDMIHAALVNIIEYLGRISLETNRWFGHDLGGRVP